MWTSHIQHIALCILHSLAVGPGLLLLQLRALCARHRLVCLQPPSCEVCFTDSRRIQGNGKSRPRPPCFSQKEMRHSKRWCRNSAVPLVRAGEPVSFWDTPVVGLFLICRHARKRFNPQPVVWTFLPKKTSFKW